MKGRAQIAHTASRPNWEARLRSLERVKDNENASIMANSDGCPKN